jgi:hypothetical protein
MHRFIVVTAVLLLVAGCGGGEGENSSSGADHDHTASTTPGREAIPATPLEADVTAGVNLLPYLDEAGTVSESAVVPGEEFKVYVFAQVEGSFQVSAAQFSMAIPAGVTVTSKQKFSERALTVGELSDLYAMAFQCHESGRFLLLTLTCVADEEFAGGEMTLRAGVDAQGTAFLGFATCGDEHPQKLPAGGGAVTLTLE